ncbi:3'-5' exonuclease [Sinomonas sp. ASV486]|uniref:3'-5' exonuclease n=1 Tax=Sinomonas sp. ASV486 TaxID=3051170 RepID=UPI0027DB0709|nr:3'-5' exonuclease [Sinomonas sp. ASV486]MDQ4491040.1 3'-5' exonuclease [Sinomonas sp. ASV486]
MKSEAQNPQLQTPAIHNAQPWNAGARAAFDLETTGRNSRAARIVTASIVVLAADGSVEVEHEWLADPGVEIPAEAAEVHGITTEKARSEGRPAGEVVGEVASTLQDLFDRGVPVVAFNASYDFTVMAAECARHGISQLTRFPVLDPYVINKQVERFRKGKRTLGALCEQYGVILTDAHSSGADALAAAQLLDAMVTRFPELDRPAAHLHRNQIDWSAAQAADFQSYLRRTKPTAVVEGDWPVLLPHDAGQAGF